VDPDFCARLEQSMVNTIPFNAALGMRVEDASTDGWAVMRLPYRADLVGNPDTGVLHGGMITSLIDACCGMAVFLKSGFTRRVATLDLRNVDAAAVTHVRWETTFTGLHVITGTGGTLSWPAGLPLTFTGQPGDRTWSQYFYVPRGTKYVGGFGVKYATAKMLDGSGNTVFQFKDLKNNSDYFAVPVPAGEDGKLWKLDQYTQGIELLTVPSYFTRNPGELLLPAEVVKKDSGK
jgi:uncharacterized protein (TIGR00369 family)